VSYAQAMKWHKKHPKGITNALHFGVYKGDKKATPRHKPFHVSRGAIAATANLMHREGMPHSKIREYICMFKTAKETTT